MVRKLTLKQAKELRHGQTVYLIGLYNADGTAMRARVSGAVKTWKTRPDEVKVPIKRGMYENGYITDANLASFSLEQPKSVPRNEVKLGKHVGKKKAATPPKRVYKGTSIHGGVPVNHYGWE